SRSDLQALEHGRRIEIFQAVTNWSAVRRVQAALRGGLGTRNRGNWRSRRQASSSPLRRAAFSTARDTTPSAVQLMPRPLHRADTAQSFHFSTRWLASGSPPPFPAPQARTYTPRA